MKTSSLPGSVTISSPSGKVGIYFVPNMDGLGGACQPKTCYFLTKAITKPVGLHPVNLKVVSGVYTGLDSKVSSPVLAVMSDNAISSYGLVVGKSVDVGAFYSLLTNPTDAEKRDRLIAYDVANTTYTLPNDAAKWLDEPEVVTARKALLSVTTN